MVASCGRGFSAEAGRELWRRWKSGESLSEIGRALGKKSGSVYARLRATGGIGPAERVRAARSLTLADREEISRGLATGCSFGQIAHGLGRAVSTISREVARNGGRTLYRANQADAACWQRAARPKPCLLAERPALAQLVAEKLQARWAPQQIASWLKMQYRDDRTLHVSHETIYKSLFIQARGVLKKELLAGLRSRRVMRRGRPATRKRQLRGQIVDAVSIRDRPPEIEDRAVPGHWEGDLLSGKGNTHIATLVERHSRYVVLARLESRQSEDVVTALIEQVRRLPVGLMASLTWDRGKEMALHKRFSIATDVDVYFCDPHSPWQRGSNENTNGLLRQYFPKGTDLSLHSQQHLDEVAEQLNTRPRMILAFQTPAAILAKAIAATG